MEDIFGVEPWFTGIYNLAIGYLGAFIFFLMQIYFPERRNNRIAYSRLLEKIDSLIRYLDEVRAFKSAYITLSNDNYSIHDVYENKIFFKTDNKTEFKELTNYLQEIPRIINNKLEILKTDIYYQQLDIEIIEAIDEVSKCKFYENLKSLGELYGIQNLSIHNFEMNFQNFSEKLDKLAEYETCFVPQKINPLNESERDEYIKHITSFAPINKTIKEIIDKNTQ